MKILNLKVPVDTLPPWADVIAVDPSGGVYTYEEDCYFSPSDHDNMTGLWIPVDDFDGLCFQKIAQLFRALTDEEAKRMYYRVERRPASAAAFARAHWERFGGTDDARSEGCYEPYADTDRRWRWGS